MHHAAGVGALWGCELLLAAGHEKSPLNSNQQSPVDVAGGSNAEVASFLRSEGCEPSPRGGGLSSRQAREQAGEGHGRRRDGASEARQQRASDRAGIIHVSLARADTHRTPNP